jgi:predicted O-methyltransferase YrrM
MNPFRALKRLTQQTFSMQQLLAEIREGIANHAELTNRKMEESIELQTAILNELKKKNGDLNVSLRDVEAPKNSTTFNEAMANIPLLIDEKTYNTSHPDYNANVVRNHPGAVFNAASPSKNTVYKALSKLMKKTKDICTIDDQVWQKILDHALEEIHQIPHSSVVFERMDYIKKYMADISKKYQAHYIAGWVNLEDALFLYWLVRTLKPKTVVQTGVCNGLSSAFLTMGLVKNGPEGKLYVIDLPAVFDPNDPAWTEKNKVYGVTIPEGKSSGWIVPEAYHDQFEVQCGDAKKLLPPLVDRLDCIDMFYHDSDHTYNHMIFEFNEIKRKLSPGGLVVADDISWNASLWDFADQYRVPAYNYKGSVGTAFF